MIALAAPLYVATGVLILAGLAKLHRPSATAGALRQLSVPMPLVSARVLGLAEVGIGVAAVLTGSRLAWAGVALSYLGFTLFVLWALGDENRVGSCGCFGREDTPVTPGHAAYNAAATAVATLSVLDPVKLSAIEVSFLEGLLTAGLIAAGIALSIVVLSVLPRTLTLATGSAPPAVREFSLDSTTTPRGRT